MDREKKIAPVAHDNKKPDVLQWAAFNRDLLSHRRVYAIGQCNRLLPHYDEHRSRKIDRGSGGVPVGQDDGTPVAESGRADGEQA